MSIVTERLSFSYGAQPVLTDVSFTAHTGQLIAILGPNGAGKTTMFRCILGLLRHYSGSILVEGTDSKELSARELAHKIAYIPQVRTQTFGYSVLDMVLMGTAHRVSMFATPSKGELDAAWEALQQLGIAGIAGKSFLHLSGGEQQLVLIARALAQRAKILLMDEPTASLDYGNQAHVLSMVRALADAGYTVMLSTHNPQHALWYADRALALHEGQVAAFGAPNAVIDAALIARLYRIRAHVIEAEDGLLIVPSVERGRFDVCLEP